MSRFAIASNFDGAYRYYAGGTTIGFDNFELATTDDHEKAELTASRSEASALAEAATELSRCLPPFAARTWFVVELPDARR